MKPMRPLYLGEGWQGRARALAREKDLSQADLAVMVSQVLGLPPKEALSRAAVGHWLTSYHQPSVAQFLALMQVLQADVVEILGLDPGGAQELTMKFHQLEDRLEEMSAQINQVSALKKPAASRGWGKRRTKEKETA